MTASQDRRLCLTDVGPGDAVGNFIGDGLAALVFCLSSCMIDPNEEDATRGVA